MPRQRSKKVDGSRKSEPKPATAFVADSDGDDSESEDLEMSDIDEEEAELTRLLLGGGADFQTSGEMDLDDEKNPKKSMVGEDEGEANAEIEDMADDEVRNLSHSYIAMI